ncbi:uncharacterized protein K460DRAFT_369334 [Cucurbitaria berberidis CBS 394.84]|uniref:Zn(2)-C6 fungal-type domain-containing protein n=1 Tax=Cucurbitaria berberidis CBS 394.84 TaxID=1168544 RepID=A0A9P4L4G6_9PLEO|nr:uncharacterized protein K460DRAFT_369334 [Cucurbitaria berberidis CBS 394.84]KAF1841294.1 hypothetical protein K460DRAFT_369334 [Cucurbitaria berberidis CBS 394.84]
MDQPENEAEYSTSPEADTKRRKLRKGTKSCWHCKKRKVKCIFDATSETVCIACRRRGAACIGQDQPEGELQLQAESNGDTVLSRIQRVEGLLEQLVEVSHNVKRDIALAAPRLPAHKRSGYFTPNSDYQSHGDHQFHGSLDVSPQSCAVNTPAESCIRTSNVAGRMTDESRKVSEELVKAFPSQQDIDIFCKLDYITTFYCHQWFTKSGDRPEHEAFQFVNDIAKIPDPSTTPLVLVAKRMIIFALFLQYFRSQYTCSLEEDPVVVMERLVDTAVRLVTTNDRIVGCIEGLECVILEGVFHFNGGNLRRAWLAFRKAMVFAQLMKIDHPNPPPAKFLDASAQMNPKFMWFRIVYMDSHLSLMLGLPHGGHETNMENEIPGEKPGCKLERVHTLIARRIIDRNRREPFLRDFTTTRELDRELLSVTKALPDRYWSPPNFTTLQPNTQEAFWETMRLSNQLHHYNLVHLLHLPYLLRCDKENSYHAYAKITCVNACREILTRFIRFRQFNRHMVTIFCRTGDFFALMAGMTILLAHIDSHRLEVEDWRAHQRIGDRAMVGQLLENLDEMGKHTNDSLTHKSAEQLRCLLEVESGAARGEGHSAHNALSRLEEHSGELQLSIPYFGIIKIGREGITKNWPTDPNVPQPVPADIPGSVHVANHLLSAAGFGEALYQDAQAGPFLAIPDVQSMTVSQTALAISSPEENIHQQQLQFPGLAASIDDWAFQGVDAAFFDTLTRGTVGEN